MDTTVPAQPDEGSVTIYRLDLPSDIAGTLAKQAEANERTVPGQIRFALKAWISQQEAQ